MWVLGTPEEILVPPPLDRDSAEARAEAMELEALAAARTDDIRDVVSRWNPKVPIEPWTRLALEYTAGSAKRVPLSSRNYALVHVAMYDAVVAAWHWKYVYSTASAPAGDAEPLVPVGPDPTYPSEHAAIAGAASRVLAHVFPDQPAARLDAMAEEAAESRLHAGANTRRDVEAGLALGRAVADAVIALADTDGSQVEWDDERPAGIGRGPQFWEPPPGSVARPDAPLAGGWDTWVLPDPAMFRPPPPPAFGTEEFRAAAQELIDVKNALTPEQATAARYWEGAEGTPLPAGLLIGLALDDVRAAHVTTPRFARALALLTVALHDGAISVWDAKFTYWNPRPQNSIRDLGLDEEWSPLLPTPLFPAYPSGSAGYAGAAEAVMSYLLPERADEFKARAEEQTDSRVYAGIHWSYDAVSLESGRRIGGLVVEWASSDESESDGIGPR